MVKKLRVTINRDQCISDMVCVSLCPDVFEMNEEDGKAQSAEKFRIGGSVERGEVPRDLEECVRSAAEACPVQIIEVEEIE
ncbi:MAG: ferredoxin [Thermoprotei archaeon]|nr:MAG: ferredoxin [Thermoprotei archaeon]